MLNWKYKNEDAPETSIITIDRSDAKESNQFPGNNLYLYSDITRESIFTLNRQIDELTKQLKMLQISYNMEMSPVIHLHISSEGGDVFPAMASVDKIKNNEIPVYTYCEGITASAATLISVVGKKRFISKNSVFLIHQIQSSMWGNYMAFKDEMQNLDLIMKLIKEIYLNHTKFDETDLNDLLKRDLYLTSTECKKKGLVDQVI